MPAPGSMAAQDALCVAWAAYTLRPSDLNRALLYRHALNAGMPVGEPDLDLWAQRRAATYRQSLAA